MGAPTPTLSADTGTVDVLVDLLAEIDSAEVGEFYDRVCEGLCRLTSMPRAGLFLYDATLRTVRAVGSHGLDRALLDGVEGTLEETPIARRALSEDRVAESSEPLEAEIPARYARFAGLTTLTCTPVAAGGRWLGVIFADRGGGRFELTPDERQSMWTLGKLAALAASAQQAAVQREASARLSDRIALTRDIHDRVIQRLFGLLLVLGSEQELSREQRQLCHDELREVLRELRSSLGRSLTHPPRSDASVRQILDRIGSYQDGLEVSWAEGAEVPAEIEPLVQSVLLEALRNAQKHADPTAISVTVEPVEETFVLEVVNDGVRSDNRGTGLGLRLATIEALQHSGIVEFGPLPAGRWHVRLVVPLGEQ